MEKQNLVYCTTTCLLYYMDTAFSTSNATNGMIAINPRNGTGSAASWIGAMKTNNSNDAELLITGSAIWFCLSNYTGATAVTVAGNLTATGNITATSLSVSGNIISSGDIYATTTGVGYNENNGNITLTLPTVPTGGNVNAYHFTWYCGGYAAQNICTGIAYCWGLVVILWQIGGGFPVSGGSVSGTTMTLNAPFCSVGGNHWGTIIFKVLA